MGPPVAALGRTRDADPGTPVVVVARARGRLLLIPGPGRAWMLPFARLRRGETSAHAAGRALRAARGRTPAAARLREVAAVTAGDTDHAMVVVAADGEPRQPPAANTAAARWIALRRLHTVTLGAGVGRCLHAVLAADPPARARSAAMSRLGEWWDTEQRPLPWRQTRDPYAVLIAEVMSQQTQIARVVEPWTRWMTRWPRAGDLAAAELGDVLRAWQGLGYPRRARDLHATARVISTSGWPAPDRLTDLPGVGPYTASALRCFAWEQPELPVDANVGRVLHRRFPQGLRIDGDPWRLGQALMEFGQRVCRARPACGDCPLRGGCPVAVETGWDPAAPPRRQAAYRGSLRERRGRLLRAVLAGHAPALADDPAAASSLTADGLARAVAGRLLAPA